MLLRLHRRALAPALSLVLAAGGVTLTAAPATAAPRPAATTQTQQADGLLGVLEAVIKPLISGIGGVGETLTLSLPQWNLPGVTNDVQWLSGGSPIPGATGTSFVPTLEQAGSAVQAEVTGRLLGLLPVEYVTNAIPIPLPGGGGGGGGGAEDPTLEVLQDPSITGIPGVGSLLQILNPIWSLPGVTTTYQWFVDNVPVPGATGPTRERHSTQLGCRECRSCAEVASAGGRGRVGGRRRAHPESDAPRVGRTDLDVGDARGLHDEASPLLVGQGQHARCGGQRVTDRLLHLRRCLRAVEDQFARAVGDTDLDLHVSTLPSSARVSAGRLIDAGAHAPRRDLRGQRTPAATAATRGLSNRVPTVTAREARQPHPSLEPR